MVYCCMCQAPVSCAHLLARSELCSFIQAGVAFACSIFFLQHASQAHHAQPLPEPPTCLAQGATAVQLSSETNGRGSMAAASCRSANQVLTASCWLDPGTPGYGAMGALCSTILLA